MDISIPAIKKGLQTRSIGREILYYPSLGSTMDTAREKAHQGAAEGTVIIAGEQTGGRGRLQRTWLTPKGNIALSIILRPDNSSLPYLIMIASLAVTQGIRSITGTETQIKWPNDVLIKGKKVCGILIENEMMGNKTSFSIIGIGINVDLKVADHQEIADTAISLKPKPGETNFRNNLIVSLLQEFDNLYLQLPDGRAIFQEWRSNLITLGKKVKATWGAQVIDGTAIDVEEDGSLTIRGADGMLNTVVAGDVTLRG